MRAAAWASWVRTVWTGWFPGRVRPERCLPALASLPGTIPAQTARREAVPKRAMSMPVSATQRSAPRWATPGMVSSRRARAGEG